MIRGRRLLAVFACVLLAIAGCASRAEGQSTAASSVPAGEAALSHPADTYAFAVNGVALYPDMDVSVLPEALGEPDGVFEEESCAAQGTARLYSFRDYELYTYPDGSRDRIQYIYLKTDTVQTMEGADLSSTADDIRAIYGAEAVTRENRIECARGTMRLVFVIGEDGYPASIEYRSGVMK